jgi:hypothetical protein
MRCIISFFILILMLTGAGAQQLLKGKIYDMKTDSVLASTTVFNVTKKAYSQSSSQGDYAIEASEGDKIIITSVGYLPDTVKVLNYMIDAGYDVTMTLKNNLLRNVTVRGPNYVTDSLSRRDGYSAFYDKSKKEMISRNGPQNGVGIAFSPIGFLSKRSKDRKMNRNLQYQEEQDFVDYSFSRRYVEKMTNLHGDSLLNFMLRYRPTYEFCRNASSEDMLHYVNDRLIIYLQHEEAPVKPQK